MTLRQFHRGGLGECVVESPYKEFNNASLLDPSAIAVRQTSCQPGALRSNLAPGSSLNPAILGDMATWIFLFAFLVIVSWREEPRGKGCGH